MLNSSLGLMKLMTPVMTGVTESYEEKRCIQCDFTAQVNSSSTFHNNAKTSAKAIFLNEFIAYIYLLHKLKNTTLCIGFNLFFFQDEFFLELYVL